MTPEERETANLRMQELRKERDKIREETERLSSNLLCPVCHKGFMTSIVCRRYGGSIHMEHCIGCEYHMPKFWHCLYRTKQKAK